MVVDHYQYCSVTLNHTSVSLIMKGLRSWLVLAVLGSGRAGNGWRLRAHHRRAAILQRLSKLPFVSVRNAQIRADVITFTILRCGRLRVGHPLAKPPAMRIGSLPVTAPAGENF